MHMILKIMCKENICVLNITKKRTKIYLDFMSFLLFTEVYNQTHWILKFI
jgi:hypothetical protein